MRTQMIKNNKQNSGYTIIETMISVSLFLVIVTSGMGALLSANVLHQKSQDMRSITDSLSFIMEEMSRNLRTGYSYRCYEGTSWNSSFAQASDLSTAQSCANGKTIVFENAGAAGNPLVTTDQWIYKFELASGSADYNLFKSTAGGSDPSWVQLNPPEVTFRGVSGFSVLGAEPPSGSPADTLQPFVSIRLIGRIIIISKNIVTPFSLQTSVSQRLIDL